MAEFCLDCWNKINGTNETGAEYIRSFTKDFCEECCEFKRVIIRKRWGSEAGFELLISALLDYIEDKKKDK